MDMQAWVQRLAPRVRQGMGALGHAPLHHVSASSVRQTGS